MGSSPLLTSCLLLLLLPPSHAQQPLYTWCNFGYSGNYSANSTFETNLNTLLASFSISTAASSGFLISSSGSVSDRVYGLALCRGDVNSTTCRACLDRASSDLPQSCPYNKNVVAWYDACLLRYSDTRFASSADYGNRVFLRNVHKISSSDTAQFKNSVLSMLKGLQSYAVTNETDPQLFFRGEKAMGGLGGYEKLYGLVQCTRDITAADCSVCLDNILKDLPSCCLNSIGGRVLAATCNFRYEVYPFNVPSNYVVFPKLGSPPPVGTPSPAPDLSSPPLPATPTASPIPPLPATPTASPIPVKKSSRKVVLTIAIPLGVMPILLIAIGCFFLYQRRKTQSIKGGRLHDDATSESPLFNLAMIIRATNNFSDKLGEGGFGAVYKGTLPCGQEIAVKRILRSSLHGVEQLKNEIVLLAKLKHKNLVRLLGVGLEGEEKFLVYEFVANKSLDVTLFDSERKEQLDWDARYKIITGIARGLLYLHEESRITIIHRDLKAANILLDNQMNPKISDFGTARLFIGDHTHASTNVVVGTFGYMSPEYVTRGQFSNKSDIYSFGILVLEIITGRKRSDFCNSGKSEFSTDLLSYVWEHWSSGSLQRIVDPTLRGNYERDEAERCIQTALLCVQEQPEDRAPMSSIVLMLINSFSASIQLPAVPAFAGDYSKKDSSRQTVATFTSSAASRRSYKKIGVATPNGVSISDVEPR